MLCPACDTEISNEANFCEKCGFKLKVEAAEREAPQTAEGELQAPEVTVEVVEKE